MIKQKDKIENALKLKALEMNSMSKVEMNPQLKRNRRTEMSR